MPQLSVLHILPSFAIGGSQRRAAALVNGLGADFRHSIVAIDGDFSAQRFIRHPDRVNFSTLPLQPSGGVNIGNILRIIRLYRSLRPDISISYNWGAMEAAMVNRLFGYCPHLHCEDGFDGNIEPRRRGWARRWAIGARARLVVPSRTLVAIAREIWRIAPARIVHLPNGMDIDGFHSAAMKNGVFRDHAAEETVIGTMTRLSPEKNLGRLLRIFAGLASGQMASLVVAGEGPELDRLRSLAGDLGIAGRVDFPGHVSDVAAAMAKFDIYVLTSDTEQMPYGILEAMACGLPVVATDVGDVRHMLSAENQPFVVAPGDEAGFAGKIVQLSKSVEARRSIGAANLKHARNNYDQARMIDRYQRLLLQSAGKD